MSFKEDLWELREIAYILIAGAGIGVVIIESNSVDLSLDHSTFWQFGRMMLDFGSNLAANRTTFGLANNDEMLKFHTQLWILNQNVW